ncbi:MAG: hypothetical protein ILA22_02475 [Prevotella sp.]|nr:hypothetical protein [Prevotella sp.]
MKELKNYELKLSEHFALAELCKTKTRLSNEPNKEQIENLKRVCRWLEELRLRYNLNKKEKIKNKEGEEPIIINSGFRSAEVNRAVGGAATSNHLTGCAVDIRVAGIEQLLRYAVILLDISDESKEDFDELLIDKKGPVMWLHFAVKPTGNRRKVRLMQV